MKKRKRRSEEHLCVGGGEGEGEEGVEPGQVTGGLQGVRHGLQGGEVEEEEERENEEREEEEERGEEEED